MQENSPLPFRTPTGARPLLANGRSCTRWPPSHPPAQARRPRREPSAARGLLAGGNVLGLAPSAAAAAQLAEELGPHAHADTPHKLAYEIGRPGPEGWATRVNAKTVVIIDEAGMADTLRLDAVISWAIDRGASVRLVGDDQQLGAVSAGGILRDIATTYGAVRLDEVVRFSDPAEAYASLALRNGDPAALGYYLDHDRVHVGDPTTTPQQVFDAWLTDKRVGLDTIMLAPTRDQVAALNQQAREH